MNITPVCGQLKGQHICQRTWFHEGDHIAEDQTRWGADESDDLGWTATFGITRQLSPGETFARLRGELDGEEDDEDDEDEHDEERCPPGMCVTCDRERAADDD